MAGCKDCIHGEVCDIFAHIRTLICNDNADKVCKLFKLTDDVVPKSEVEELICKLECLLCHVTGGRLSKHTYDLATMETVATDCINETYNDGYGEGYKDCATEIFAEIENWFELYSEREYSFAEEETAKEHYPEAEAHDYALDIIKDLRQLCIAELKKKYTEGETDEKQQTCQG